jgi:pimeloyl-ACP methyl ester carboxylesterase
MSEASRTGSPSGPAVDATDPQQPEVVESPGAARLLDVGGYPVRVEDPAHDHAKAETVVMLHGWPDTLALWDGTVAALSPHYRCVRLTLPGFGDPLKDPAAAPQGPVPTLSMVINHLKRVLDTVSPDRPVTLLIHDWGCMFGYELAQRFPDRVARVVAVDIGDYNAPALQRSLSLPQKLGVAGYQLWLALAWQIGRRFSRDQADRMTRWMADRMRCPSDLKAMHAGMNYLYSMRWFGTAGGLGSLQPVNPTQPLLYLYGTRKPFMFHSPEWLSNLQAREGCEVQAIRSGHWVMSNAPEAFHAAVLSWLQGGHATAGAQRKAGTVGAEGVAASEGAAGPAD